MSCHSCTYFDRGVPGKAFCNNPVVQFLMMMVTGNRYLREELLEQGCQFHLEQGKEPRKAIFSRESWEDAWDNPMRKDDPFFKDLDVL